MEQLSPIQQKVIEERVKELRAEVGGDPLCQTCGRKVDLESDATMATRDGRLWCNTACLRNHGKEPKP